MDPMPSAAAVEMRPLTVSVEEAARLSSLSRTTLYALMSEGKLHSRKLGKRRLVLVSSLEQLVGAGDA